MNEQQNHTDPIEIKPEEILNITDIIGLGTDINSDKEKTEPKPITGRARSLLNLHKPWKKGENPNPNNIGKKNPKPMYRAKHDLIKTLEAQLHEEIPKPLLEEIKKYYPKTSAKLTSAEAVMLRLQLSALAGEPWAVKEVVDRLAGPVKQKIEQTNLIIPGDADDMSADQLRERLSTIDEEIAGLESSAQRDTQEIEPNKPGV